jgi:hypothetical protein
VTGAISRAATRIVAGVGDLVQRTGDGHTGRVHGGRMIERSSGAVCGLHRAHRDEKRKFLGCASKPGVTVFSSLASKPVVTVFSSLTSKPVMTVFSSLASKLAATVSPGLVSKSVDRVSQFGPQNWQLRFVDLGLKTKRASVCRLYHKTDRGRMAWDMYRDLVACFFWKQVVIGFSSLASRLAEV